MLFDQNNPHHREIAVLVFVFASVLTLFLFLYQRPQENQLGKDADVIVEDVVVEAPQQLTNKDQWKKTYVNQEYGFKFDFPFDWEIDAYKDPDNIVNVSGIGGEVSVRSIQKGSTEELISKEREQIKKIEYEDSIREYPRESEYFGPPSVPIPFDFHGVISAKQTHYDYEELNIISIPERGIEISYPYGLNFSNEKITKIIDSFRWLLSLTEEEIIADESSIKILDYTSWKRHHETQYGIEFSYPDGWEVFEGFYGVDHEFAAEGALKRISIEGREPGDGLPTIDIYKKEKTTEWLLKKYFSESNRIQSPMSTTISGYPAEKYISKDGWGGITIVWGKIYTFVILYSPHPVYDNLNQLEATVIDSIRIEQPD